MAFSRLLDATTAPAFQFSYKLRLYGGICIILGMFAESPEAVLSENQLSNFNIQMLIIKAAHLENGCLQAFALTNDEKFVDVGKPTPSFPIEGCLSIF